MEARNDFTLYSSLGTLASLACSKVALVCWSFDIHGLCPDEVSNLNLNVKWFVQRKLSCTDVYKSSLPSSIVDKINRCIKIVGSNLRWLTFRLGVIFNKDTHDVLARCIDHVIVEPDGTISPEKTVRNLLEKNGLNVYEKYALACEYCFESDIRRLWPSVSGDPFRCLRKRIGGKAEVEIGTYPMMYYWNRRMNDLASSLSSDVDLGDSPWTIASDPGLGDWPWTMIEYLWKQLAPQSVVEIREWRTNPNVIRDLFLKSNIDQLMIYVKEDPLGILICLIGRNEENSRYAVQIWDHLLSSNEITKTVFAGLMLHFRNDNRPLRAQAPHDLRNLRFPSVTMFLRQIWSNARQEWKKEFLNCFLFGLLDLYFRSPLYILLKAQNTNKGFFLQFLTNLESQDRTKLWLEYWKKFIVFADASDLQEIVELCLPQDNEQIYIEFRKRMVDYKELQVEFDVFIAHGRCVELEHYLKLFSSSEDEEKRIRRQISDSTLSKIFQFDSETLKKFGHFFDSAFTSTSSANQQKEEYFRKNIDNVFALLDQGSLNNMKNVHFLISHNLEYLAEMKQIFLLRCRNTLISGSVEHFDIRHWQEFIQWCSPTDEDFVKFKESLPLDEICHARLVKCCQGSYECWCEVQVRFTPLSNFLRWYLGTKDAVEKYLLENIGNYEQMEAIRKSLKLEATVIFGMLKWIFDGNGTKIKKFCTTSGLQIKNVSSHLGCRKRPFQFLETQPDQPAIQPDGPVQQPGLRRSTRNRRKPDRYQA